MNEREKTRSSTKQPHDSTFFDFMLSRPPVLGEESSNCTSERGNKHRQKFTSPILLSSTAAADDGGSTSYRQISRPSSRLTKPHTAPPDCFSWHKSLHNLLQDSEGVKLFLRYLDAEAPQHAEALHFWFACEGLKNHNEMEKIQRLVKLIYKTYFMKSALPINDELRRQITKNLKSPQCLDPPITLFDEAQAQVEYLINKTTYPNFLNSDLYLQYLQSVQNPNSGSDDISSESSSSSSSISNKELANLASGSGPLPTVHEDLEFSINPPSHLYVTPGTASVSTGYHTPTPRLTKDSLRISQKHRALEIRPKSESYAGYIYRGNGAHAAYNSYNPVSRQDSDIQSLSSHSDCKTESDNMSLAERSIDGRVSGRSRHKSSLEAKLARESASLNKEADMQQAFIPRTQRLDTMWDITKCIPMDLEHHAAILKEKLEKVRKEQENQELFDRKLKESDSMSSLDDKQKLENVLRVKLQIADDNDQDILDEHVSRVFSDHSLSISSGLASPRQRRDRDGFSTFSGDSGNVHDFPRANSCRASSSKKTRTDLTDSGVSVVSDSASLGIVTVPKDSRVMTWLMESDRSGKVSGAHAHSELAVGRKYARKYGSRSNSLERNSVTGPAQPFIADPSMPPLPLPNTDIQLEEIRRRLTEDDVRSKTKQRTLNKYSRGVADEVTIAVFTFCDEQFPYRTKIPGTQITLRQFKEYLPKKGNYRYFFKTVCEDLSNQVTNEEVSNDSEVLPLWEGKIMAQVKPID